MAFSIDKSTLEKASRGDSASLETLVVALGHGEEASLGPDVPAGFCVRVQARRQGGVEQPGQANRRGEEGDTSTHGSILA